MWTDGYMRKDGLLNHSELQFSVEQKQCVYRVWHICGDVEYYHNSQ